LPAGENFGPREDSAGVNVVQQQDALAARLDTADGASRNLAIVDAGPVVGAAWATDILRTGWFWVWLATVWPSS
jgi:hypothetical protein